MISKKEIREHLKYLKKLKHELANGRKTPMRKRDKLDKR